MGGKKMKRRTGISLMMALLMIVSTFAIIPASVSASCPPLVVTKKVWDGDEWISPIYDVVKGDIVMFNITVTFNNYHPCQNNYIYDIIVEDYLPDGLIYKETVEPREPDEFVDNKLVWNFTDGEVELSDGESFSIIFTAVAEEYGEQVNNVDVTAIEFCNGEPLSADAYATVYVEPRLDVEKTVWNPDAQEWVKELDGVIKDVDVHFQIIITYHGPGYITCMEVVDEFQGESECLEYLEGSEEFTYPNDELFDDPEITVSENRKEVTFKWGSDLEILFNLKDGESIIIRFDANVTNYCYYEYSPVINHVDAYAKNCENCEPLEGSDQAEVNCRPHDPIFEKTVWNGKEWAEETYTHVGEKVRFKLELTYYGDYNLTDIEIVDYLPEDILEYVPSIIIGSSTIPIKYGEEVYEDGKTVSWNIEGVLNDGETLIIEFYALVIGSTGACTECGTNIAEFSAIESENGPKIGEDTAKVISGDEINICINVIRFGIGRVHVNIFNVGDEDLKNVEWTIEVKGSVLKRINVSASCTVDLPGNSGATVSLPWRSILRKFGQITGTVTVTVPGSESIEKEFKGFVIGRIVLVRPLIRLR